MEPEANNQPLSPEMIEQLRALAREDLFFLAKGILGYDRLSPKVHGPLCRLLEDTTKKRKLIVLPRGWFKTTLVSIAYPIWNAIRNPNIRILIAQNTHTNALAKLASIDRHFRGNELFKVLFPELLPTKECTWRADSMCVPRSQASPESTFEAAGTRTQVVSRHYDIVIEDDTVAPDLDEMGTENLAPTKDDIEQAIGWHRLVPPLLDNPQTSINIVVGTRWFERDLISWIQDNQKFFFQYVRSCRETNGQPDPKGELTFPEYFNEDALKELESSMGPYLFSCLYLNTPINASNMTFQPEWFVYYETLESNNLVYWTTVDPAGGSSKRGRKDTDYQVVITAAKDLLTGRCYVVEYDRFRGSPGDLIDTIFKHVRLYKPLRVGVEAVAYQNTLLYWVKERQREADLWFNIEPITHGNTSKEARIIGLQPLVKAGKLLFRTHHKELVTELLTFPLGAHDDIADALSMQLGMWLLTQSVEERKDSVAEDPFSVDSAVRSLRDRRRKESRRDPLRDLLVSPVQEAVNSFWGNTRRRESVFR